MLNRNNFDILPDEMVLQILSNLSPDKISEIATVNKQFSFLVRNNVLWKLKIANIFPTFFNPVLNRENILSIEKFPILKLNIPPLSIGTVSITTNQMNQSPKQSLYAAFKNIFKNVPKGERTRIAKLYSLIVEEDITGLEIERSLKNFKLEDLDVMINEKLLLQVAQETGNQKLLDYLYGIKKSENRGKFLKTDAKKRSILTWAILCHQRASVISELIQHGAKLDDRSLCRSLSMHVIHTACRHGQLDTVKVLIKEQPSLVNTLDDRMQSPLQWAAHHGHADLVEYLIQHGADLNHQSNDLRDKMTALHYAVLNGHTKIVHVLIDNHARVDLQLSDGQTPLHLACKLGHSDLELVELLFKAQPNLLNQPDIKYRTSLLLAIEHGHAHIVEYFAQKGADLNQRTDNNIKDHEGYTFLHWAAEKGHLAVIKALIKHGVELSIQNWGGQEAIHLACGNGHLEIVKALLEKQPDLLNKQDVQGLSPMAWAARGCHAPIVEFLCEQGANLNLPSNEGNTPLHLVAGRDDLKTFNVLLKYQADVSIHNNNQDTAFDLLKKVKNLCPELKLATYLFTIYERPDDDYDTHHIGDNEYKGLTLFGACQAGLKKSAALHMYHIIQLEVGREAKYQQFKELYSQHKKALRQGELKKIYNDLLKQYSGVNQDDQEELEENTASQPRQSFE